MYMNSEKHQFNKIAQFITDSYNDLPKHGTIIVKSVKDGFVVNGVHVKKKNNIYSIEYNKNLISTFSQIRIAILFAALISKKRYIDSNKMPGFDRQLDILLEDKNRFTLRLNKKDNPVLYSRLSKTENDLELLDQQLRELEKSLSLQ
jgi:hypothetical protein